MSLRTSYCPERAVFIAACLTFAALALILAGCGNSGSDAGLPATPSAPAPHTAASGPAVSGPVSFDQLTLESKPQTTKDKNGLAFLKFRYADNDGKVYDCVLPKAMSQGQYTLGEWLSTFNAYRLPKVVAQKKIGTRQDLGDYPFISPKPAPQVAPEQPGGAQPETVPQMPPGIGAEPPPPPPSAPPGGMPGNPP
jgi:hypothetical protein